MSYCCRGKGVSALTPASHKRGYFYRIAADIQGIRPLILLGIRFDRNVYYVGPNSAFEAIPG